MNWLNFQRNFSLRLLSALDSDRLCDLGLSRQDLVDARRAGGNGLSVLEARRQERAHFWLR